MLVQEKTVEYVCNYFLLFYFVSFEFCRSICSVFFFIAPFFWCGTSHFALSFRPFTLSRSIYFEDDLWSFRSFGFQSIAASSLRCNACPAIVFSAEYKPIDCFRVVIKKKPFLQILCTCVENEVDVNFVNVFKIVFQSVVSVRLYANNYSNGVWLRDKSRQRRHNESNNRSVDLRVSLIAHRSFPRHLSPRLSLGPSMTF